MLDDAIMQEMNRYRSYLSCEQFAQLLEDSQLDAPSAIRINALKTTDTRSKLNDLKDKYDWQSQPLPFSEAAEQITDWSTYPSQTIEHKLGQFYIQDAASILPVSLFKPSNKPLLSLDMAASPGGKTTQMIDAGKDQNLVIANDSAASRIPALRTVLQTWGTVNYAVTNFPGERWGDWYPETFDQILLDAPCSMQSLRVSSSHPHRPITSVERERLAARQLAMLTSAARALKVGGELVYSTCTLAPEEDEAVVSALLKAFPGAFQIDTSPASRFGAYGLTGFETQTYDPQLKYSVRIWPFVFQTNGFFAVKLIKLSPISEDYKIRVNPPQKPADPKKTSQETRQLIVSYFNENYGFSLEDLLEERNLGIYWRGEKIWLMPNSLFMNFPGLSFNLTGISLGQFIRQDFEPASDFFQSFGHLFSTGIWTIPTELMTNWMKGYDIRGIDLPEHKLGSLVLVTDENGNNLGAGKYSRDRLRNLLPNRHLVR